MTWTARATVQDVSDGAAPIVVLAVANADETYDGAAFGQPEQKYPCVTSNTEGKIRSVEIKLVLDEDASPLQPGDVIQLSGHFAFPTT